VPPPQQRPLNIEKDCPTLGLDVAQGTVREGYSSSEYDIIVNETLPIRASLFWELFFSDEAEYPFASFHVNSRRDDRLAYTTWHKPPHLKAEYNQKEGIVALREFSFVTEVDAAIGPKTAYVIKTQRLLDKQADGFLVEASSVIPEVMYGSSFSAMALWSVQDTEGGEGCRVVVSSRTFFLRNVWIAAGMIRRMVRGSAANWYASYFEEARNFLSSKGIGVAEMHEAREAREARQQQQPQVEEEEAVDAEDPPPEEEEEEEEAVSPVASSSRRFERGFVAIYDMSEAGRLVSLGRVVNFLVQEANVRDRVVISVTSENEDWTIAASVASQMARLKRLGIKITVCVDTHLSGPMLIAVAALADNIVAAPFSHLATPSLQPLPPLPSESRPLSQLSPHTNTHTHTHEHDMTVRSRSVGRHEHEQREHELTELTSNMQRGGRGDRESRSRSRSRLSRYSASRLSSARVDQDLASKIAIANGLWRAAVSRRPAIRNFLAEGHLGKDLPEGCVDEIDTIDGCIFELWRQEELEFFVVEPKDQSSDETRTLLSPPQQPQPSAATTTAGAGGA